MVNAGELMVRSLQEQWRTWAAQHRVDAASDRHAEHYMEVLGPVPSPIARLKDRYRYQCMVKYRGELPVTEWIRKALESVIDNAVKEKLQISVDVDPQSLM